MARESSCLSKRSPEETARYVTFANLYVAFHLILTQTNLNLESSVDAFWSDFHDDDDADGDDDDDGDRDGDGDCDCDGDDDDEEDV